MKLIESQGGSFKDSLDLCTKHQDPCTFFNGRMYEKRLTQLGGKSHRNIGGDNAVSLETV